MCQLADQHRMVQVAYSACQHRMWHAQLNPQGTLEPVGLLGQYCRSYMVWWYVSCGCTASERLREIWHHVGWP